MDVQEQRVRFVVAAHRREKTMVALCQEFGISRPVGYEWLKRYRQGGVESIAERSRRPQKSPRRTEGAEERRVLELGGPLPRLGRASCECCCNEKGSNWRAIRSIAFCCGTI
jgi:transposase-like protein